jgi:hypothetical protein
MTLQITPEPTIPNYIIYINQATPITIEKPDLKRDASVTILPKFSII